MKHCILIVFDDSYFKYGRVCLNSLTANYPDHPVIKVLYTGNESHVKEFVRTVPNTELLEYQFDLNSFKNFNLGVVGSPMIYIRFIAWSDLFKDYDNVMYLDCDTVVLQPLSELFETKEFIIISDNFQDTIFLREKERDARLLKLLDEQQLSVAQLQSEMANSGVFVIPKKYRSIGHFQMILSLRERYNDFIKHSDQSVISIWCKMNNIPFLRDFRYNFQTHFIMTNTILENKLSSIKIMHYTYYKPTKNFEQLLAGARYVLKAQEVFETYS